MTTIAKIITRTITERHDVLAGTNREQHEQYLADGFIFDWRARQYRRTTNERFTVDVDGVLTPILPGKAEEAVAPKAAA
jgi:hypothetical protein